MTGRGRLEPPLSRGAGRGVDHPREQFERLQHGVHRGGHVGRREVQGVRDPGQVRRKAAAHHDLGDVVHSEGKQGKVYV